MPKLRFGRITSRPSVSKPRARKAVPASRVNPRLRPKPTSPPPAAQAAAAAEPQPVDTGKRVLVVDDDDAIRKLVTRVLVRRGFAVEGAKDGGEGLLKIGAAGAAGFDLILLDLMMPNISGFDFIEHFNAHQPDVLKRIVVMTASPKVDHGKIRFEMICGLLEKPFDIDRLADYVQEHVKVST